jgi:hypothetical protein
VNHAAVAFIGAAGGEAGFGEKEGAALGGDLGAEFAAFVRLMEQRLSDRRGAALIGQGENFELVFAGIGPYLDLVAHFEDARGFGRLSVAGDVSAVAGCGRQGAGLEEARGPEPFVDAKRAGLVVFVGHSSILLLLERNHRLSAVGGG